MRLKQDAFTKDHNLPEGIPNVGRMHAPRAQYLRLTLQARRYPVAGWKPQTP